MEDFAARTVDLGRRIDSLHVSETPKEEESTERIGIDGEARTTFRDLLEWPQGPRREAHLCRHALGSSPAEPNAPCHLRALGFVPLARMSADTRPMPR